MEVKGEKFVKKMIAMMVLMMTCIFSGQIYAFDASVEDAGRDGAVAESVSAFLDSLTTDFSALQNVEGVVDAAGGCCKVCRAGKACGNSCISASKTCNVGPGCACNG